MKLYKVRTSPQVWTECADWEVAVRIADQHAVYGAVVTDMLGKILYAPFGETSAELLHNAKAVCDYIRDRQFVYGHAPINPAFHDGAVTVSCDRLMDWILFRCGYMDQPVKHGECVSGPGLGNWCQAHGFEKILSVDMLEPGDIVFTRKGENGFPLHTFMHAGKSKDDGMYYRYDAGKVERIRSTQPSCEPLNDFMYAYRVPGVKPAFRPTLSFRYDGIPFEELGATAAASGNDLTYTLPDGLELTVRYEFFPEYNVIKWTNYWNNPTDHPSGLIEDLCDCDITLPVAADKPKTRRDRHSTWEPETMLLHVTQGANVADDDHRDIPVRMFAGDHLEEKCLNGRSGQGRAPFFEIEEGGQRKNGMLLAVGWTGQWKARFDRGESDMRIRHGIEDVSFRMEPGERFRTASTTVMVYTHGRVNAHNCWRKYIREVVSPFASSQGQRGEQCPFSAIFWGGIPSDRLIRRWQDILANQLPMRWCWVDAGWYEPLCGETTASQSAEWPRVGTWEVNRKYHPHEYQDVVQFFRENGIKFQLWFEPERTQRDVSDRLPYLYISSPEENNVLLALNEDAVCDSLIETVSSMVDKLKLGCYRQDFNISPLEYWNAADRRLENGSQRKGITQIHYINNLWRFWDTLLERHPHLLIDNCAGGGHRIDIEMLSRSVPLWRSDYQCTWNCCPEANQNQNASAALWYPYSGIGFGPDLGDTYGFRSAYTNGMTVRPWEHVDPEWDVGGMNEPMDWARKYFGEYDRIRHYFAQDYYPLLPVSLENTSWSVSQYHDSADDSGLILAFRRAMSPSDRVQVFPGGLDTAGQYRFVNEDTGEVFRLGGHILLTEGLTLILKEKRSSLLLTYHKI